MARQTATAVALDHAGLSPEQKLDLLRTMLRIRVFEDRAARVYTQGKAGGFMHLYNGQEASGVGAMAALRPDDVRVDGSDALAGRLHAHGIWPGTTISVVRRAPMGGPMQLSLQGFRLALRLGEAKRVVCRRIAAT